MRVLCVGGQIFDQKSHLIGFLVEMVSSGSNPSIISIGHINLCSRHGRAACRTPSHEPVPVMVTLQPLDDTVLAAIEASLSGAVTLLHRDVCVCRQGTCTDSCAHSAEFHAACVTYAATITRHENQLVTVLEKLVDTEHRPMNLSLSWSKECRFATMTGTGPWDGVRHAARPCREHPHRGSCSGRPDARGPALWGASCP